MSAISMDGNRLADDLKADMATRVAALAERGITPGLGTILVGDDGPSAKYVGMKHRDCAEVGMHSVDRRLPADATQDDVHAAIDELNADPSVDAFIVQYPFPKGLDYGRALLRVDPAKDADGLHPVNLGLLVMGEAAPVACTPRGIVHMLHAYDVPVAGQHVVIVGRGLTIGRPLANLLALKGPDTNAAVTVVHTGVEDLGAYTRTADIVVAAAGSPGLITADMVRPGAAVVAAGVSVIDGKVVSDVDDQVGEVAGWLSPRIGGVGAMTRAFLLMNTLEAAERAADRDAALAGDAGTLGS
jgi:methylenetetrahydrofolate dehydrogenase (NADP+)/methenyltetrahydrofolate cyclohydrolase